jgi:hypothetical protein
VDITVKTKPFEFNPPEFTITFPVAAPFGTVAEMLVAVQLVVLAAIPLKATVPDEPKLVPVIVTAVPTAPVFTERLVMVGFSTVKLHPLLLTPLAKTTTFPVVAPEGTVTPMLVAAQLVTLATVPLNVTDPDEPKLVPVIVTAVPVTPLLVERPVTAGAETTVKLTPLLFTPASTTTFPVAAPLGTVTPMPVPLQLVGVASVPLNFTVPDEPKLVPIIVTAAPTAPVAGDKFEMAGATVKLFPLLVTPLANTTTLPVVASLGTVTPMLVALQLVTAAVTVLKKVTLPEPCVDPKFVPVIVTATPAAPVVIDKLVMLGAETTVKLNPLLFTPLANTTTLPVAAPVGTVTKMLLAAQVVTVAAFPLKLTVPDPWVEPKFVPVIVTAAPTAPVVIERLLRLGAETTVKLDPLLFTPLANTTTFPVVAPLGTVTFIVVAFQLVTVAPVPLKLTVPDPCVDPKLVPVIVTAAPTAPVVMDRLVILGAETTVKLLPLLATPETVTTTLPVVAPDGTVTVMLVVLQFVAVAAVPLNLIVLVPCGEPKFVPAIVTVAPNAPVVGDRLVIVGAAARAGPAQTTKSTNENTKIAFHFRRIGTALRCYLRDLVGVISKIGVGTITTSRRQ